MGVRSLRMEATALLAKTAEKWSIGAMEMNPYQGKTLSFHTMLFLRYLW